MLLKPGLALALTSVVLIGSPPGPAPGADPIRVVVLGTFHMSAAGDPLNPTVEDVLEPRRQAELSQLVERLARFRPTRIAVEALASAGMQSQFERYLRGDLELAKDERHQVAFRLARAMGHTRIHSVDHDLPVDVEALLGWARAHDQSALARALMAGYGKVSATWAAAMAEGSMLEIYRAFNARETDAITHDLFLSMLRIGSAKDPVGAAALSRWYERNIRIAGHIVHLAEPGDRILVLIGANHRKLLIEFLRKVPGVEVEQARNYLGDS